MPFAPIACFFLLFVVAGRAGGQAPALGPEAPTLSPEARVSMLTALRGKSLYETWGHTAIRVRDPRQNIDQVFNYGTFDFDQPGFYLKFLRGQLDYRLASAPFRAFDRAYRYLERPVIEQTFDLSLADRQAIFDFLVWNDRPENRDYRYDFFFDNCSTRPRDVLEAALGDRLVWNGPDPGLTFRELLDPGLIHRPWSDAGIDVALGSGTDRLAAPREALFLPLRLFDALEAAELRDSTVVRPLVAHTDTLFWIEGAGEERRAFPLPFVLSVALLLLGLGLTIVRRSGRNTRMLAGFDSVLFLAVGLAGTVFLLLWTATEHAPTESNWNLLWAWPTHLALMVRSVRTSAHPLVRAYLFGAILATALAIVGWFGAFPQFMHPAAFPVAVLTGIRLADHWWVSRPAHRASDSVRSPVGG